MATAAIAAIGTKLYLGNKIVASTPSYTEIAEVLSISGPTLSRDQIDVTNQATTGGFREFIGGLGDPGELTFDISYVPTAATHADATGLLSYLSSGAKIGFLIAWPDGVPTKWEFDATVNGFEAGASVDEQLKASVTLRLSGLPDFSTATVP